MLGPSHLSGLKPDGRRKDYMTEIRPHPPPRRELSKSITLSGRDLEDARRLLEILAGEPKSTAEELACLSFQTRQDRHEQLRARARNILESRQRRIELFGRSMFGEPGWEILLRLYASAGESRQSMSRLAELSGYSKATAIRWMDTLTDRGLINRHPHPTDLRTIFVELSERGRERIETYLGEMGDFTG